MHHSTNIVARLARDELWLHMPRFVRDLFTDLEMRLTIYSSTFLGPRRNARLDGRRLEARNSLGEVLLNCLAQVGSMVKKFPICGVPGCRRAAKSHRAKYCEDCFRKKASSANKKRKKKGWQQKRQTQLPESFWVPA